MLDQPGDEGVVEFGMGLQREGAVAVDQGGIRAERARRCQLGIGEDEAYALLRKTAMDQNKRVADVAQALVTAAGLLS